MKGERKHVCIYEGAMTRSAGESCMGKRVNVAT